MAGLLDRGKQKLSKAPAEGDPADLPRQEVSRSEPTPLAVSDGDSAGGKASGFAGDDAGGPAVGDGLDDAVVTKPREGRRRGRPRGPERAKLSVRILAANDAKLTRAVEQTGQSPQYLVDQALALLFAKLRIKDGGSAGDSAG